MSSMRVMNPRVAWFVKEMQKKLAVPKNQEKGDPRTATRRQLLKLLEHELLELKDVIEYHKPDEIIEECADCANFLMMIADKVHSDNNGN